MGDFRKALVVIPAWNEAAGIAGVIAEIKQVRPDLDIVVIDDGSTDETTHEVARSKVSVVTLPFNLGVGGAMRAGFVYAQQHGYQMVIQVDADGQHFPGHIWRLEREMSDSESDIVIGSRFLAGSQAPSLSNIRLITMKFLAWSLSRVLNQRITDGTSGFRASGPRAIATFAEHYPSEYLGDTIESLVIASKLKLKVSEVAVTIRARSHGVPSQSRLKAAQFTLRAVVVLAFSVIRKAPGVESNRERAGK